MQREMAQDEKLDASDRSRAMGKAAGVAKEVFHAAKLEYTGEGD